MSINIENLLDIPAVRQALQQYARETGEAERRKRIAIIDEIQEVEAEMIELEKERVAARKKFDQANAAMQIERGKLGNVTQRQGDASRRYNNLHRTLKEYGERIIIDAAVRINCVKSGVESDLARREAILAGSNCHHTQKDRARDRLDELRRYLPELIHAGEAIEQLRLAPLSPAEIAVQVAAIMDAASLPAEKEAA